MAGTTYSALFLALSAVTRHAVVAGLIFVLIWEGLPGNSSAASRGSASGSGASASATRCPRLPDPANLPWALGASVVVTVGGVWFAGDRLRSFALTGED